MLAHANFKLAKLKVLEVHVASMASLFDGPFTAQDLAAASFSRWRALGDDLARPLMSGLRILRAVCKLVEVGILKKVDGDEKASGFSAPENCEVFQFQDRLLQIVLRSSVPAGERNVVRRQALVNRRLTKDLPERVEEARKKKAAPHIPWYYQIEQGDVKR